jgi:hypothetical protein
LTKPGNPHPLLPQRTRRNPIISHNASKRAISKDSNYEKKDSNYEKKDSRTRHARGRWEVSSSDTSKRIMKQKSEEARMQFTRVLKQAFDASGRKGASSKYVSKGASKYLAQLVADTQFYERASHRTLYAQSSAVDLNFKPATLEKLTPWPAKAKERNQLG